MADRIRQESSHPPQGVEAAVLGSTRVSPPVRDALVHTDPALLHAVPRDDVAEATLARVEDLLGKGHFGPALQEASGLEVASGPLATRYGLINKRKYRGRRSASPTATSCAAT